MISSISGLLFYWQLQIKLRHFLNLKLYFCGTYIIFDILSENIKHLSFLMKKLLTWKFFSSVSNKILVHRAQIQPIKTSWKKYQK